MAKLYRKLYRVPFQRVFYFEDDHIVFDPLMCTIISLHSSAEMLAWVILFSVLSTPLLVF